MRAFFNKLGFLALVVVAVVSFSSPAFAGDNELEALTWVSIAGKALNPQDEDISVAPGFSPFAHFILPNGMGEGNWIMGNPFRVPQGTIAMLNYGISDPGGRLRRLEMKTLSSSPNVVVPEFNFETKNTEPFSTLDGLPVMWDGQSAVVILDSTSWPVGSLIQLQLTSWYKVTVAEEVPLLSFVFGPFDGSEWIPVTHQINVEVIPLEAITGGEREPQNLPQEQSRYQQVPLQDKDLVSGCESSMQLIVYESGGVTGSEQAYNWDGKSSIIIKVEPIPRLIHWHIEIIDGITGEVSVRDYEGLTYRSLKDDHSQLRLKYGVGEVRIYVWDPANPNNQDSITFICYPGG